MKNELWRKSCYSLCLFLGIIIPANLLFQLEKIVARALLVHTKHYEQFMYGMSIALLAIIFINFYLKNNIIQLKTKLKISLTHARLVILLGLVSLVFCHAIFSDSGWNNMGAENTFINYVIPLIIIKPIFQELIFRNGIQELLINVFNVHFVIAITSLMFALASFFPDNFLTVDKFLQSYIVSTVLGYIYRYSGSIVITVTISSLFYLFVLIAFSI